MTCIVKALEEAVSDVLEKMFLIRSLGQPLEEPVFPAAETRGDLRTGQHDLRLGSEPH